MSQKIVTTDPPRIDVDDFEDYLVTDELFVDYFNTFLGLPSFPEPLRFNTESGGFEVLTSAKYEIADKIKAAVKARTTPRPQTAASRFFSLEKVEDDEEIKTSFSVQCLDKEQGIQWIKEERLPSFLKSELYSEYRLAKLLSQVETSPGGMKLTIDPDFRPWYKPKAIPQPPVAVDETEELIQRMYVTLGSTNTTQTKEWYTAAKHAQEDSTKIVSSSKSNVTVTGGPWARPQSSSRPTSVDSSQIGVADDSSAFLLGCNTNDSYRKKNAGRRTVHFEHDKSSGSDSNQVKEQRRIPEIRLQPISQADISVHAVSESSQTTFGKVARVEPDHSDDDSDQGMGSECFSSIEDITESSFPASKDQEDDSELDLRNIDDYSSTFVAICLKNAVTTLKPNITENELDDMKVFEELIPKPRDWLLGLRYSKKPFTISKLDETVFAQAIVKQESRVLKETGSLSRASQSYGKTNKTDTSSIGKSDDILDLLKLPKKKLTFNETTGDFESRTASSESSDSDGYDSIFSEKSYEIEEGYRKRSPRYDLMDFRGFEKFKKFIKGTMGENIMLLWMDIDKSRFSLTESEVLLFVSKARQKYLSASSINHISKELLKNWDLDKASLWKPQKLRKTQRKIAESLLLYWAPRFMIHLSTKPTISIEAPGMSSQQRLLNREIRPLSSQTFPTKKTAIIKPLRPKSCLPKLTEKKHSDSAGKKDKAKYHEMGMYQKLSYHPKYQQPMYHALTFKPYSKETKKPKSLFPPEMEPTAMKKYPVLQNLKLRPASAEPMTAGTLAIVERKARSKSARVGPVSYPMEHRNEMKTQKLLTKRSSMSSEVSSLSSSSTSSILGSEPMESMLQALYHDTRAGLFFTRFCEQSGQKEWSNAIHFWFDTQEFHSLFYRDAVDIYVVQRKAQAIYSRYIVVDGQEQIGLAEAIRKPISKSLEPAFDELFDEAEEYTLKLLIVPWNEMLAADQDRYKKVELIEQERNVKVAAKYARILQKKEEIQKKHAAVAAESKGNERYEEDLRGKVPEEFRDFSFDDLIRNRIELEHFRKFLEENYAKTDLLCWLDIEGFKRVPHQASEKRDEKAKDIKNKYLHKKYFFGPSSPATKEQQTKVVEMSGGWGVTLKERPPNELILEAQKYVYNRLANRWLPRFLATPQFAERQRPPSQMSDVVEDVVLQKRRKRGEPWKILDNKWQSSSRELVEFRHALANPVTSSQFRRYVSLRGEFLENDVLFWLEVQKYKDFCHSHSEQSAIDAKISAIIHCFLDSQIPPAVQIDVPSEIVERILQKKKELGPYIFREAQLTVLRVLFPHWSGFCKFRKNLTDEKLTTTLERQRARKMERIRKQLIRQQNEQIAREQAAIQRELEEKEANQDPLADILSSAGSEGSGSIAIVEQSAPSNQIHWSYGKYVEALDKERNLLLMENELRGRIPTERLPKVDEDVSSDEDTIVSGDSSDTNSNRTSSRSSSAIGRQKPRSEKKRKEKVIYSTITDENKKKQPGSLTDSDAGHVKKSPSSKENKTQKKKENETSTNSSLNGTKGNSVLVD